MYIHWFLKFAVPFGARQRETVNGRVNRYASHKININITIFRELWVLASRDVRRNCRPRKVLLMAGVSVNASIVPTFTASRLRAANVTEEFGTECTVFLI